MATIQLALSPPEPRAAPDDEGLSTAEARRRLEQSGPNEPAPPPRIGLRELLSPFANPLIAILLAASAVAAALGELVDAAIIVVMVVMSAVLNTVQSWRSHRAADRLRQTVALTATVRRDGAWLELPRRELVVGDVIRLAAGDMIPADARLLAARDLHVQQAALTGESMPVEKEAPAVRAPTGEGADATDRVFMGSSVVSGTATALVTATGRATAFGDIAARLAARAPHTEFERGITQLGQLITQAVVFLVLFIVLTGIVLRHDALESLLFAVALAVGLVPEFLPMITSVTLANGAVRMAREKVIVKRLAAIQNFGSIDVLCSDKTGTLTSGEPRLVEVVDAAGARADEPLRLARLNSHFQTGIHSPLDVAILAGDGDAAARGYTKLDEVPFDFERRRLSIVTVDGGERVLITKGAPESVLACCAAHATPAGAAPLDAAARARAAEIHEALGARGHRVLAVAHRVVPEQPAYRADDERDLVLDGFLAFIDPPLPDTAEVLDRLRRDGVRVVILTGDNELVTREICARVGLAPERIVLGAEVDRMSDGALGHVVEHVGVFARVAPAQKGRVLAALRARGHVVGFLGDGINDAPSLRAADVGISVSTATDVAKDAADVILQERGLGVLHTGILEGRKAFANVMKYLMMGTSSAFGNMLSMAVAPLFLPFLPMLPTQILLNNFLYDVAQVTIPTDRVDEEYVRKPRRWDIGLLRRFMLLVGPISSVFDLLTFGALLLVFGASERFFHTGWFVESLFTQTLVLFVIRTGRSPLRSRPSRALAVNVLAVVVIGGVLPFTPLAEPLGFVPLPPAFLAFVAVVVTVYLGLVELAKRRLVGGARSEELQGPGPRAQGGGGSESLR